MTKRLGVVLAIAAIAVLGPPMFIGSSFELRIVDDGNGVEGLLVTADNGLLCRTQRGTGACLWWASSLMGRSVPLSVSDQTNQFESFGTTLTVWRGREVVVTIHRRL